MGKSLDPAIVCTCGLEYSEHEYKAEIKIIEGTIAVATHMKGCVKFSLMILADIAHHELQKSGFRVILPRINGAEIKTLNRPRPNKES